MDKWSKLPDKQTIDKTIEALKVNGIGAEFVENGEQAKQKVLEILPKGAEVMTMSSMTLQTLGLIEAIDRSGKYNAVKPKLMQMDRKTERLQMQKMGAAPEYAVGSVNALTEDGHVLIGSQSGSQIPAYAYGSAHVIWVVGVQKIVKNTEEGIRRIYDYVLPKEDERARKAYGVGSAVSKLLIINKENKPGRLTLILVGEKLGF